MATGNPVGDALGAISEELDLINDSLVYQSSKVDALLENQEADGKVLREIQQAIGRLSDGLRELPELRRRVAILEGGRGAHADAE